MYVLRPRGSGSASGQRNSRQSRVGYGGQQCHDWRGGRPPYRQPCQPCQPASQGRRTVSAMRPGPTSPSSVVTRLRLSFHLLTSLLSSHHPAPAQRGPWQHCSYRHRPPGSRHLRLDRALSTLPKQLDWIGNVSIGQDVEPLPLLTRSDNLPLTPSNPLVTTPTHCTQYHFRTHRRAPPHSHTLNCDHHNLSPPAPHSG